MENKKIIFVCSPLSGDIPGNIEKAKRYCRRVIDEGHVPYAPHLFFTQFLSDDLEEERKKGMQLGQEMLRCCDEVWCFVDSTFGITPGMQQELFVASKLHIPTVYLKE